MTEYGTATAPMSEGKMPLPLPLPPSPPRPAPENTGIARALPLEKRPPRLYLYMAIAAVITGIACSLLFGDAPGLGLNITLGIAVFFTGWYVLSRQSSVPPWRKICAGLAVCYGVSMALRASEILFTVNMLLAIGFASLACMPAYTPTMKKAWATMADLFQVALNFGLGWIFTVVEFPWKVMAVPADRSGVAFRIILGVGISVPFLIVFGFLFAQAELRFALLFETLFSEIVPLMYDHFWITFWVAIFSLGLFRSAFISASLAEKDYDVTDRGWSLGIVESGTVLSLLNAMFLIFVATQLPYLFGGQDRVSATPGLQWSQYARSGFFELAWVAGLLIPTLMLFINVTRTETARQKKALYGLCGGLTALGGIIIVSALQRMLLYTANFGLTELRVYVSAFIIMLACVLVLLNVLSYVGRSSLFLPAALGVGILFSAGIQLPNIQGIIATDIIHRHLRGKAGDMNYLKQLSPDAVPAIARSGLPAEAKRDAASAITGRATAGQAGFNWIYQPLSVKWALDVAPDNITGP